MAKGIVTCSKLQGVNIKVGRHAICLFYTEKTTMLFVNIYKYPHEKKYEEIVDVYCLWFLYF